MKTMIKLGLSFAMTTLALTAAVYAAEYNFYEQSDKKAARRSSPNADKTNALARNVRRTRLAALLPNATSTNKNVRSRSTRKRRIVSIAVRFPTQTRTS